jgi:drug/metabolite transporter (DMT)-like permease
VTGLSATTPIITILLAAFILSEPITSFHVIGILLIAFGNIMCFKS